MQPSSGRTLTAARQRVTQLLLFSLALGLFLTSAAGQKKGGTGSAATTIPLHSVPNGGPVVTMPPRNGPTSSVFLNGHVVLDQGTIPPQRIVVQEICGTIVRASTHTDMKGNFTLSLGQASDSQLEANADAAENGRTAPDNQLRMVGCELRAVLSGYVSSEVHLSGSDSETGMRDVGTLILKRVGGAPPSGGTTISATSFQVPDKARKEFDKAAKEAEKSQPDRAIEHLRKSVEIYPNYAAAWVALGQVQTDLKHTDEATAAFKRAIEADAKYVPPYIYLALLAVREKQWQEALQLSDRAVRLDPVNFADAYFLNAIANFNLHHLQEARTAALKAADMDGEHHQPRIQYLLAAIYEATGERDQAAQNLREFIRLAPNAPDLAAAKQQLEQLSKQTATAEPQ